jgi:integrase
MAIRQRHWIAKGGARTAWVVDYFDAKGKRRLKTFRTKRAALDWGAETRIELKQGIHVADRDSITVAEAGHLWLTACEEDGLERATLQTYGQYLHLHIEPFIGAKKLSELTVSSVRALHDQLRAEGRSQYLAKRVITYLGALMADAQDRGLATRNPVRERKRQRRRGKTAERHEARLEVGRDIPTPAEIKAILRAAAGSRRALFATGALAGLRASELRGLTWRDVNLAAATITIRRRADKWGTIGNPKAAASQREIPLPPLVVNALREWKLACPKGPLGLVFPNGAGNVENYKNLVERQWLPLQVAAGVSVPALDDAGLPLLDEEGKPEMRAKYPGLHVLRHFFASWCAARPQDGGLGLPLKTVQARMGHSTLAMTADTYGHLFPSTDDAEVLAAGERALMGS